MTEEREGKRFSPVSFSMIGAFFVFSAASFVAPEYIGAGYPWRLLLYAVGGLFYLLGCLGFMVAVGSAYGGSEGFWLSFYMLLLFSCAAILHLATVFIPMSAGILVTFRVIAYVLILPLSLLVLLGAFRAIEGLSTMENRADAILTSLALFGALLPILASLLGNP